MMMRRIATGFCFAALSCVLPGANAWAKPADLPSSQQIECDCQEGEPATRKLSLKLGFSSKGITLDIDQSPVVQEPAPTIDAFLPAFVEQMVQHATDALSRPDRSVNLDYLLSKLPYSHSLPEEAPAPKVTGEGERQLRQLFEKADSYGRAGLSEAARFLYQRVHLLSPTSRLGRMAIDRLQQLENQLRDDFELQEMPNQNEPEARNRDLRRGTVPLGLVEVSY